MELRRIGDDAAEFVHKHPDRNVLASNAPRRDAGRQDDAPERGRNETKAPFHSRAAAGAALEFVSSLQAGGRPPTSSNSVLVDRSGSVRRLSRDVARMTSGMMGFDGRETSRRTDERPKAITRSTPPAAARLSLVRGAAATKDVGGVLSLQSLKTTAPRPDKSLHVSRVRDC